MEKLEREAESAKFKPRDRVRHYGRTGTVIGRWSDTKYIVEFDDSPDDTWRLIYESELTPIPTT